MRDIVERLNVYGRSEFWQSVPGFMFVEAATEIARLRAERDALLIALHDAIRRPMGVVPASADPFYSPSMADEAEAIRALKSPKPQED